MGQGLRRTAGRVGPLGRERSTQASACASSCKRKPLDSHAQKNTQPYETNVQFSCMAIACRVLELPVKPLTRLTSGELDLLEDEAFCREALSEGIAPCCVSGAELRFFHAATDDTQGATLTVAPSVERQWEEWHSGEREPYCIFESESDYNTFVRVLEVPHGARGIYEAFGGCRLLLLDHDGHLHSVYRPNGESRSTINDSGNSNSSGQPDLTDLSGGVWDHLATLPSLVPPGPIAMLGLGAGTVPRIIAAHYPCGSNNHSSSPATQTPIALPAYTHTGSTRSHWCSGRDLAATASSSSSSFSTRRTPTAPTASTTTSPALVVHGWELDPAVVQAARSCMGMDEMERRGQLVVHVGDALRPSQPDPPGGFSGVIVDMFAGDRLLPQLTKRATWEAIRARLVPQPAHTQPHSHDQRQEHQQRPSSSSHHDQGRHHQHQHQHHLQQQHHQHDSSPGHQHQHQHHRQPLAVPRLMANLGVAPPGVPGMRWHPEAYTTLRAYEALEAAFDGEVSLITVGRNTLALTGPQPPADQLLAALPPGLRRLALEAAWARDVYPLQNWSVGLSLW